MKGTKHKNVTISVPIGIFEEIDSMRREYEHGQSEMYLYLLREGIRVERRRRKRDEKS